jgi:hypothetical protein
MAFTKIASYTATSNGVTSIAFSSIPATYKDLYIAISVRSGAAASRAGLTYTFNSNASSVYVNQLLIGYDGGSLSAFRNAAATSNSEMNMNANTSTANTFGPATMYIANYANTSNWKQIIADSVGENMSSNPYVVDISSGLFMSTAAISSVSFSCSGNFQQWSKITLYGV